MTMKSMINLFYTSIISSSSAQCSSFCCMSMYNIWLEFCNYFLNLFTKCGEYETILSNKKIGGILIEKQIMGTEVINIIGIGLNLSLPEKESWWDDLSVFNLQNKRDEIINSIIENFLDYIDNGIQNWEVEWENACMHIDYEITIKQNEQIIDEGKFVGINKNGSIKMISKKNNSIVSYENGDVSIGGVY